MTPHGPPATRTRLHIRGQKPSPEAANGQQESLSPRRSASRRQRDWTPVKRIQQYNFTQRTHSEFMEKPFGLHFT